MGRWAAACALWGWLLAACWAGAPHTKVPSAVLELNDRFLEVRNEGVWFVKFYAPWCGHCKSLAPVWEQLAHELDNVNARVRVAKLDCTRFGTVAAQLAIAGYPTLKFFRHGVEIDYEGERTKDALVTFALNAIGPDVRPLESAAALQTAVQQADQNVIFVLIDTPNEPGTSPSPLPQWYASTAGRMFTKCKFYSVDAALLPDGYPATGIDGLPAACAVRDGQFHCYDHNAAGASENDLWQWAESERWPTFPMLGYALLRDAGTCCNKLLALATLDFVARGLAERMRQKDHPLKDRFLFGWLDGNYISSSVALSDQPTPSVLVLNYTSYEFYLPEDPASYTTDNSLHLFLTQNMFSTQPLLTCCLFGLPSGILAIICYSLCSADFSLQHEEVYPDSDTQLTDEGSDHEKYE